MDSNTACSTCCYGTCSTTTCTSECTADTVATDCGADKSCCGGKCSDTACQCTVATEEADCGAGHYCCDGVCNATSCPECKVDDDCTTGDLQYCSFGRCVECKTDDNCTGEGEECFSGQCRVPSDSNLNDTGITVKKADYDDSQYGRDVTDNNGADGHAGFSFTKIVNGETCIQDTVTGLTWSPDQEAMNYAAAQAYVTDSLTLCGLTGWRIPTAKELVSIVSYDRTEPAVDSTFFTDVQSATYWTSTPNAGDDTQWVVSFSKGNASNATLKSSANIRLLLVRP